MRRTAPFFPDAKNVMLNSRVNFLNMLNKEFIPNFDDDFCINTDASFENEILKEFN